MFFSKKSDEKGECRYCRHASEAGGAYICRYKGQVEASGACRRYSFDPFAKRERRPRNLDTSAFDPLDFEI